MTGFSEPEHSPFVIREPGGQRGLPSPGGARSHDICRACGPRHGRTRRRPRTELQPGSSGNPATRGAAFPHRATPVSARRHVGSRDHGRSPATADAYARTARPCTLATPPAHQLRPTRTHATHRSPTHTCQPRPTRTHATHRSPTHARQLRPTRTYATHRSPTHTRQPRATRTHATHRSPRMPARQPRPTRTHFRSHRPTRTHARSRSLAPHAASGRHACPPHLRRALACPVGGGVRRFFSGVLWRTGSFFSTQDTRLALGARVRPVLRGKRVPRRVLAMPLQ